MEKGKNERKNPLDSNTAIIFMDISIYYEYGVVEEWLWHVTGRILTGTINAPFRSRVFDFLKERTSSLSLRKSRRQLILSTLVAKPICRYGTDFDRPSSKSAIG